MGAFELSITETVALFGVIPFLVIGLLYSLVYGRSAGRAKRYRPGRPFAAQPVWYLANHRPGAPAASPDGDHGHELAGRTAAAALTPAGDLELVHYGETGGASDSW
jgi:hypothetical protein